LARKPKSRKLAEVILANETLTELSNVTIHKRRVTPIDKHRQVGRWKVIKEELEKRDLPVTSKELAEYGGNVEWKWASSGARALEELRRAKRLEKQMAKKHGFKR
jgi:hypothetical protein